MTKEYAIGVELSQYAAKRAMKAGKILITADGKERGMIYKNHFAGWGGFDGDPTTLLPIVDFSGWYICEREDWPCKDIVTKKNTDTKSLRKCFFD